ncbi:DUF3387 domain-containing protein [Candidatus Uabimicrobium sp. HlEnr_7]|uniref:DUF3387 domain-containing protein n=1 Tax=Candidatus Uabimicrobium helgolandensis TaxID=3095367 RepID=UPI00355746CB
MYPRFFYLYFFELPIIPPVRAKKGVATKSTGQSIAAEISIQNELRGSGEQLFEGFNYESYFSANTAQKLSIILQAQEYILGLDDGKVHFCKEVIDQSKAFALSIPNKAALEIKEKVAFFQAIKTRLIKFDKSTTEKSDQEIETAIRQVIDKAIVSNKVVDIFEAAGIKKPDISILSEEFMAEIRGMQHQNVAIELLRKLLNDEIKSRTSTNIVQSKKLAEMLEDSIRRYQNKVLTATEVINELISLAKDIKKADHRNEELGLSSYELAFYDALAQNISAKDVMGTEKLKELAIVLVDRVRKSATIDWNIKESARAKLKVIVKRLLRKYGYPPDMQALATETVLEQTKLFVEFEIENQ